MKKEINIGMIGTRFMGRAHSNAYIKASHFFDLPVAPVLHTACGRNSEQLGHFVDKFNWIHRETSWEHVVAHENIDLIDICAPNDLHRSIALEAAKAGKHLICEKPMARNFEEAKEMYLAVKEAGVINMMVFNYRFIPAITLAKKMIEEGKIGNVRHFNAVYYQDWLVDPGFPLAWRHDVITSGSGAHGDMGAHIVDLARYLIGEFEAVNGIQKTFINERPLPSGDGRGKVTADDATSFLARFQNGALGSFLTTRLATGKKNFLRLEIFGSEGGLMFNLERMNELGYFSTHDEPSTQGYKTILVTDPSHPYMEAWWPPGHVIGWEHAFVHQIQQLMEGIGRENLVLPDFYDGLVCQHILDAVVTSMKKGSWIGMQEVEK